MIKKQIPARKKHAIYLASIILLSAIGASAAAWAWWRKANASDAVKFSENYPLIGQDNVFVHKKTGEIIDILGSGTGIVFLGFPQCIWCQAYAVILHEVAQELGVEEIFYGDIRHDRQNNTRNYQTIVSLLDGHLHLDDDGKPRIYVPDLTVVKDGQIVGRNNETSVMEGIAPVDYWTNSRVDTLKRQLSAMIKEIYPE